MDFISIDEFEKQTGLSVDNNFQKFGANSRLYMSKQFAFYRKGGIFLCSKVELD